MAEHSDSLTTSAMHAWTPVMVTLYEGAYGPTLQIDVCSQAQLTALKQVFSSLSSAQVSTVEFRTLVEAVYDGLDSFILNICRACFGIKTTKSSDARSDVVWSMTTDGWNDSLELLEGFSDHPGHHYLTKEGQGDALVVVSFLGG
jgi:hypothetical protein